MPRVFLVIVIALATVSLQAQGGASPAATAGITIRGVVMAQNDAALPRVRVVARQPSTDRIVESIMTDGAGRFALSVPSAAELQLTLSKAGYATHRMMVSRANVTPVGEMVVRLPRGAAIGGRVTDRTGEPAILSRVIARRLAEGGDQSPVGPLEFQSDANDLGEYRIGGLPEGRYTVVPQSPPPRASGRAGSALEPVTVSVRAGDEISEINFTVDPPPAPSIGPPSSDPDATGVVRGRITTAGGQPVPGALVRALAPRRFNPSNLSDAKGQYILSGLEPGDYRVEASRNGYVTYQYGQTSSSRVGRTIAVGADRLIDRVDIALPRPSAVEGTVVDEYGEPLQDVAVDVIQVQSAGGRVRALRARGRRTDDRGRYRVFGVTPGTYVVRVQVGDVLADFNMQGYSPVYHPGSATVEEATRIDVAVGRDAVQRDIVVRPTPAFGVTGHVVDSSGKPFRARLALIISERSGAIQVEPVMEEAAEDGSFRFENVPPGDYVLQAFGPPQLGNDGRPFTGPEFAAQFVTITAATPPPLSLKTSRGATLTGRIRLEGRTDLSTSGLTLVGVPTDFDRAPMMGSGSLGFALEEDGRFRYAGLTGPRRLSLSSSPPGWYLKSAFIKGEDVSERPFDFGLENVTIDDVEVVVSPDGASLSGYVTGERGVPATDYAIIAFSTDAAKWFQGSQWLKTVRPLQDGGFRVAGLPPGEYWLIAVDRLEGSPGSGEWQDANLLRTLSSRATRVSVGEGESRTLMLRMVGR